MYFEYATVLLQAMTFEADEAFLFALLDFTKWRGPAAEDPPPSMLTEGEEAPLPPEPQATSSTEVFFESLDLQPVQLDLSFMRTGDPNSKRE